MHFGNGRVKRTTLGVLSMVLMSLSEKETDLLLGRKSIGPWQNTNIVIEFAQLMSSKYAIVTNTDLGILIRSMY